MVPVGCHVLPILYTTDVEFHKTYKQRLLLIPGQTKFCEISAGIVRQVYNTALEQRKLAYSLTKTSLNYYDQAKELPELKAAFPYIGIAPSQSIQQGLTDLQKAYDRFFKGISGFPNFRKRGINDSFRLPDPKNFKITRISKRKGSIKIPKLGRTFFRWTQKLVGKPLFATITKNAGNWYISITCSVDIKDFSNSMKPIQQRTSVGIDRGCTHTIATSEPIDKKYLHSLPTSKLKHLENRIKFLQRILARKVKRSNNYKKVRTKIAKIYRKLMNLRYDWHHKMTTKIAKNHSYIFLENLDVRKMTKSNSGTKDNPGTNVARKTGLNKSILRQGWGIFDSMLTYKTSWYGSKMAKPNPAYTSQKCQKCKFTHPLNRDGETFYCRRCKHREHSDVNAAKNILEAGLALIACETSKTSSQEPPMKPKQRKRRSKVLMGILNF